MSRPRTPARLVLFAVLVAPAACDDKPITSPTPGESPLPSALALSLKVTGPEFAEPGETVRFTATVGNTDGSPSDVTAQAVWQSVGPAIEVRPNGVAIGRLVGHADVLATLAGLTGYAPLNVLEKGTFMLGGVVIDGVTKDLINTATVTVVDETGRTFSEYTGYDVGYAIFGVRGQSHVTASCPGYETQELDLKLTDHRQLNFTMKKK